VRVVVLDNLSEGVLIPDVYDPTLNPLYRDLLAHYGAVSMPCRVQHPDRQGQVAAGIGQTQRTSRKGLRFESLEEAQTYLDRWEARWADTRIHGTTKRQVAAMFAEEKPSLLPLPIEPFRFYSYRQRTVHLDGCVEVEAAQMAARLDPELPRTYQRLKMRRSSGVAKVAVARRLAIRLYWMLRTRHDYAQPVRMSGSPSCGRSPTACGIVRVNGRRASLHEAGRLHGESWPRTSGSRMGEWWNPSVPPGDSTRRALVGMSRKRIHKGRGMRKKPTATPTENSCLTKPMPL